jgi:hypothetical protein
MTVIAIDVQFFISQVLNKLMLCDTIKFSGKEVRVNVFVQVQRVYAEKQAGLSLIVILNRYATDSKISTYQFSCFLHK